MQACLWGLAPSSAELSGHPVPPGRATLDPALLGVTTWDPRPVPVSEASRRGTYSARTGHRGPAAAAAQKSGIAEV